VHQSLLNPQLFDGCNTQGRRFLADCLPDGGNKNEVRRMGMFSEEITGSDKGCRYSLGYNLAIDNLATDTNAH
jgi:hypothetical protein